MDELKSKVVEHDYAIKDIAKSIHELSEVSKESNTKLGQIAKSMGKQELILEKLTNLEGNTKDSINSVHKRIDGLEAQIQVQVDKGEQGGCTALKLLKEKENTNDAKLLNNVKSNQHRLDKLESIATWLMRTIIGTLITGAIGLLFFFARSEHVWNFR